MSRQGRILASACFLVLFLAIVVAQPLLEPSYDPLRQEISEFVHTGASAVVLIGFVSWAVSLGLLAGLISRESTEGDRRRLTHIEVAALLAAVAGLGLVTLFATDRGAEVAGAVTARTTAGRLHDAGSALITLAMPVAVVADGFRQRDLRLATVVIGAAVCSGATLFALGDPLPGLRQRFLVASACCWEAAVLLRTWLQDPTSDRSSEDSRCNTS